MSIVTPRLFVFVAWKYGDRSHHCAVVRGWWFIRRAPSGRVVDSTWITSAPNMPSVWAKNGPAQNDVKSATRRPSNGRVPAPATGSNTAGAAGRATALMGGPTEG